MDAAAEVGSNLISKHQIPPDRLTRDGTAGPVSQEQILRRERGQGKKHFPCSADHEQDWQPYLVDPLPLHYVMTIHTTLHYGTLGLIRITFGTYSNNIRRSRNFDRFSANIK